MLLNEIAKSLAARVLPERVMQTIRAHRSRARGDNPEMALLPSWNRGGTFIDVGANIGDWSRVGAQVFQKVMAFEPNPKLVTKLRRELPPEVVTVLDCALSDEPGFATLHIPVRKGKPDTGLASLDPNAIGTASHRTVQVRTTPLDEFRLTYIDAIKIDVEGFEERVLRGAVRTIERNQPVLVVEIEDRFHPGENSRIFHFIEEMGYRAYYLGKNNRLVPYHVDGQDKPNWIEGRYVNNFIFVPRLRS